MAVGVGSRALLKLAASCGFASVVVVACATGGAGVDTGVEDITETTTASGGSGGSGGTGGVLVTSAEATTTTSTAGGMGGQGGDDLMCEEDPCRVMAPQCGCPSGEKCTLQPGIYVRGCREAGTGAHGEVCTSDADCAPGTYCMLLGGHRVCRDFCESDTDCAAPGGRCQLDISFNMGDEMWCSDNCDPITNNGCPGSKCELLLDENDAWYTVCIGAGTGVQGTPCTSLNDCAAGYSCLDVGGDSRCRQWCDVSAPSCNTGTCLSFQAPAPTIGGTEYGGCD
jgi:hypothetical protein